MKQAMTIVAHLNEPDLLRTLVEKISSLNVDLGYSGFVLPGPWKAIETSSTQAYVLGSFALLSEEDIPVRENKIPFASCFLFTCIKYKNGDFNLEWSSSLS
jgi:hypothetical protein